MFNIGHMRTSEAVGAYFLMIKPDQTESFRLFIEEVTLHLYTLNMQMILYYSVSI